MIYHRWDHTSETDETAFVPPDGCRDIIFVTRNGKREKVFSTEWETRPRYAQLSEGTSLVGFRLRPGVTIKTEVLSRLPDDLADIEDVIHEAYCEDVETTELIDELTFPNATIAHVAKHAGVSPRTLQRRFHDKRIPRPDFWRLLARARRAAIALPCRVPLVEIALNYGYSDQAHMNREFIRWFGVSPAYLRKNIGMIEGLQEAGLGNWSQPSPLEL